MKAFAEKYLKYILLVLGIAMLVFGLYSGDAGEVMKKAVAICMECIGIG
ncbi:MAG: hypothetical protein IJR00_12415 [Lachnospiraceae bacterium]|nr:hypothetical protein [Lachnospiraceae bacterium]